VKNIWIIISLVAIIGALAGLAFFTHLERPQQSQPAAQSAGQADSEAMMEQITQQIASLKLKVEENPQDLDALIALGNMYFDANMPSEAVEYYERALKVSPDNSNVWTDLGTMYRQIGKYDKAVESYDRAVEVDPRNKNAWFNLGIVYRFDRNEPKQALRAWKKFLELVSPDDPHYQSLQQELERLEQEIR
jgi:cytochrome c-type biogenesis protein CcmH/NrfG